MRNAGLQLWPHGYSKLEGRRNQRRNEKGFFVSPDGDSSVQGLLGLEAVLFDEAEESVLIHL